MFYGHSKIEWKAESSPIVIPSTPCPQLPMNFPHYSGAFAATDEPPLMSSHHPKSVVYLTIHCWRCGAVHSLVWTNV